MGTWVTGAAGTGRSSASAHWCTSEFHTKVGNMLHPVRLRGFSMPTGGDGGEAGHAGEANATINTGATCSILPDGVRSGAARLSLDQTMLAVVSRDSHANTMSRGNEASGDKSVDENNFELLRPCGALRVFILSSPCSSRVDLDNEKNCSSCLDTHSWCRQTSIETPGVLDFSWRAIPERPRMNCEDGIPVPTLKPPAKRFSSPALVAIDKDMQCTCILRPQQHQHFRTTNTDYNAESILANFSVPNNEGLAFGRMQLRSILLRYGITQALVSSTLHTNETNPQEFTVVLYTRGLSSRDTIIPSVAATLSINLDGISLCAIQFLSFSQAIPEVTSASRQNERDRDAIQQASSFKESIDSDKHAFGADNKSRVGARLGNQEWRNRDNHLLDRHPIVDFKSVLPQCTVVLHDKLWTLEEQGILKVWDLVRPNVSSRHKTLVTIPGDETRRGGLLAVVNVHELISSETTTSFRLGRESHMAVSEDCAVVTISTSRKHLSPNLSGQRNVVGKKDEAKDASEISSESEMKTTGKDEKSDRKLLIIDLDEYFHIKPAQCDWDTLNFVTLVQAKEVDAQMSIGSSGEIVNHDRRHANSKRNVGASNRMAVSWASASRNLKLLYSWWSTDSAYNPRTVRHLLSKRRLGVSPKAFHWIYRKIDYRGGKPVHNAFKVDRKNSFLHPTPCSLIGEEDSIFHTVSGPDGYGGIGHDYVLGAQTGSGVRNPFSPYRKIDVLSHNFLPRWSHTSSILERREPNSFLINRLTRPDSMWVNGFTISPRRPTIAGPSTIERRRRYRRSKKRNRSIEYELECHNVAKEISSALSVSFTILPLGFENNLISLAVNSGSIQAVCIKDDGTQCIKTFCRQKRPKGSFNSGASVLTLLSQEFGACQTAELPSGASLLRSQTKFSYFVTASGIYSFLPCGPLNKKDLYEKMPSRSNENKFSDELPYSSRHSSHIRQLKMTKKRSQKQFKHFADHIRRRKSEAEDHVLSRSSSRQKIINNLIVFCGNPLAMHLCILNDWSAEAKLISITALALSLRHHELRWLSYTLESLHDDLRLKGNRMLMHYIRVNWATFQDRNSFNGLLRVAQRFVTRLIDDRTSDIAKNSSKSQAISLSFFGDRESRLRCIRSQGLVAEEVIELMVNLKELREIGFYLNRGSSDSKFGNITQVLAECIGENGKLQILPDEPTKMPLPVVKYNWISQKWDGFVRVCKEWSAVESKTQETSFSEFSEMNSQKNALRISLPQNDHLSRALNILSESILSPWAERQRQVDDNTIVQLGIGVELSSRYEQMEDTEIVYHAARTGQISAALAFLAARRMQRLHGNPDFVYLMQSQNFQNATPIDIYLEHVIDGAGDSGLTTLVVESQYSKWSFNSKDFKERRNQATLQPESPIICVDKPLSRYLTGASFDWLQNEVGCLAYNHLGIEIDDVSLATRMLRYVGINVSAFFRDVAFYTTRRNLRWKLLEQLAQTSGLSMHERQSVEYLQLIESLYPNTCYTSEFGRVWSDLLDGNLPFWKNHTIDEVDPTHHPTQFWPPKTLGPSPSDDIAASLGYGSLLRLRSYKGMVALPSTGSSISPYLQSFQANGSDFGVGCGYVVEVNLNVLGMPDQGVKKSDMTGYATEDSESDNDDFSSYKKEKRNSIAVAIMEKNLRCGDIDDLSPHGTKNQLGPSSSRKSSRSRAGRQNNEGVFLDKFSKSLVNQMQTNGEMIKVSSQRVKPFYDRSAGNRDFTLSSKSSHANPQYSTPVNLRHQTQISDLASKNRLSSNKGAGFSIYKRWKPSGPALAWTTSNTKSSRNISGGKSTSSSLAQSPSSETSEHRYGTNTDDRWLPWRKNNTAVMERGYMHLALAWVRAWDDETRERVLIERAHKLEKRSVLASLPYMISHNDWRGIVRWIDSMYLGKSTVDPYGCLTLHSSAHWTSCRDQHKRRKSKSYCNSESSCSRSSFSKLISKLKEGMRFSSIFIRELVTNELAKRGVFLENDIGFMTPKESDGTSKQVSLVDDQNYWKSLLRRLSRSNLLFRECAEFQEPETPVKYFLKKSKRKSKRSGKKKRIERKLGRTIVNESKIANLSKLLPFGVNSAPFHRFFVQFCIQHNFTHVLRNYLDHYRLGLGPVPSLKICSNPLKPWALLLLKGRLGYFNRASLFEAALYNARFCLYDCWNIEISAKTDVSRSFRDNTYVPEKEGKADDASYKSLIQVMLDQRRVLMALGTLMYAPLSSMEKAWKSHQQHGEFTYSVSQTSLRNAVKSWPTLQNVIFGAQYSSDVPGHTSPSTNMQMLISSGDIRTWKGDETMFILLSDSVSFSLKKVFGAPQYVDEVTYEKVRVNSMLSNPPLTTLTGKYSINNDKFEIDSFVNKAKSGASRTPSIPAFHLYFSSSKLQEQAFVESRGAAYYLSKGWPLQAFHRALAEISAIRTRMRGTQVHISHAEYSGGALLHDDICTIPVSKLECMFNMTNVDGSLSDELVLKISSAEAAVLQRTTRKVALRNLLKPSVLAACICFLDLCGLDTVRETLRVDAEAAMRIFQWRCQSAGVESKGYGLDQTHAKPNLEEDEEGENENSRSYFSEQRIRDNILNEIASLFIAFPDAPEPEHSAVNTALAFLGETTRALVGDVTNKDSGSVLAWKLVSVFCRVHGLKTSIALLQELARRNDCITFLHEAQRENFEPRQVVDIVRTNFDDEALRDHLYVVAQNMAQHALTKGTHFRTVDDALLEGSINKEDVFDILFSSQIGNDLGREGLYPTLETREESMSASRMSESLRNSGIELEEGISKTKNSDVHSGTSILLHKTPGRKLLIHALQTRRPILAIIASCFADAAVLECWGVWLFVHTVADNAYTSNDATVTGVNESNDGVGMNSRSTNNSLLWTLSDSPSASMNQLRPVLISLCKRHEFAKLLQSFSIFAPNSILMQYFLFYKAFVGSCYDLAAEHMYLFVSGTMSQSNDTISIHSEGQSRLENQLNDYMVEIPIQWIKQLAFELSNYLLKETITDPYGCEQLLSILSSAKFSPEYEQLYRTHSLLQRMCVFDDGIQYSSNGTNSCLPPIAVVRLASKNHGKTDTDWQEPLLVESIKSPENESKFSPLERPTLIRMSSVDLFTPPPEVLTMLIKRGLFSEARDYAKTASTNTTARSDSNTITEDMIHDITIAEVGAMLKSFQSNFLWNIGEERTKFWMECYNVFERHNFPRIRAAEFFGDITVQYKESLTAKEHVDILCMAKRLYCEEYGDDIKKNSPQFNQNKLRFVQDLDLQIMMIRSGDDCCAGRGFVSLLSVFDNEYKHYSKKKDEVNSTLSTSMTGYTRRTSTEGKDGKNASKYLRCVVAYLVNTEKMDDAMKLCKYHNFRSLDVEIVRICLNVCTIASRSFSVRGFKHSESRSTSDIEIPQNLMELIRSRTGTEKSVVYTDPRYFLVAVSKLAELSKTYCTKIIAMWDVMKLLSDGSLDPGPQNVAHSPQINIVEVLENQEFNNLRDNVGAELFDHVRSMEPVQLLTKMLSRIYSKSLLGVESDFSSCHSYINNFKVSQEEIARALSIFFIQSVTESISMGTFQQSANQKKTVGVHDSNEELSGEQSYHHINLKIWETSDLEDFVSLASIEGKAQTGLIIMQHLHSNDDEPAKAGKAARMNFTLAQEIELVIIAHFCFLEACHLEGIEMVLDAALQKVRPCVRGKEYVQLARLYQGLQEYEELEYILDVLMAQGQYDLILKLGNGSIGTSLGICFDSTETSMAIHNYLSSNHSSNMARLVRAYMHFNMNREIADTLHDRALRRIAMITSEISRQGNSSQRFTFNSKKLSQVSLSPGKASASMENAKAVRQSAGNSEYISRQATSLAQELLIILQLLIEASKFYSKDDCFQHAARCMGLSDFFTVVLSHTKKGDAGTRQSLVVEPVHLMGGLTSQSQAADLLGNFGDCSDAIAMAQGCQLSLSWQTWTAALYEQVVKHHNLSFLEELHASDGELLAPSAFYKITELFKADPQRTKYADAYKSTLKFWLCNIATSQHEIQMITKCIINDEELRAMGIQAVAVAFLSATKNDQPR